jgi:hypothetical protein
MPQMFYPRGRNPMDRRLGGPHSWSGCCDEENNWNESNFLLLSLHIQGCVAGGLEVFVQGPRSLLANYQSHLLLPHKITNCTNDIPVSKYQYT